MVKLPIGDKEHDAIFSVWTLTIYEQEFKSDMIKDVLGKITPTNDDVNYLTASWNTFGWNEISKAAWAAIKAADDTLPSYEQWAKEVDGVDLDAINDVVIPQMLEKFFPSRATVSQ